VLPDSSRTREHLEVLADALATPGEGVRVLDDLKAMRDKLAALPEPVAYIVLDHSWSPSLPHVRGYDARGKLYVLGSPAVLDSVRHARPEEAPSPLFGVPIYRRENMPEGWPER
jgi:hypothetical protein